MSDPASNSEIEDVLASIRRLVSEHAKPPASERPKPVPAGETDKLVLTPALRVTDSDAADPAAFGADTGAEPAPDWHGAEAEPEPEAGPEAETAAEDQAEPEAPAGADGDDSADPHVTETEVEEAPALFTHEDPAPEDVTPEDMVSEHVVPDQAPDHAEPTGDPADMPVAAQPAPEAPQAEAEASEAADEGESPEPPEESTADAAAPELVEGILEQIGADASTGADDADAPYDADSAEEAAPEGDGAPEKTLEETIAELEAVIGKSADTWDEEAEPAAPESAMPWEDWTGAPDGPEIEVPEVYADKAAPEEDDAPDPEPERQPVFGASVHRLREGGEAPFSYGDDADEDDQIPDFLAQDEDVLDEEALRELVAEIVRQELQGALGERITRNVRKLVRREIHRALASQELE